MDMEDQDSLKREFLTMLKFISGVSQWGSGFNSLCCSASQGELMYAFACLARGNNLHELAFNTLSSHIQENCDLCYSR